MSIAGHVFSLSGLCSCGRRWIDIRYATRSDVGQPNIAHQGLLTHDEYDQIAAEAAREDERIARAIEGVVG